MNILLINGSPRGAKSNSLKLARAFLEGFCEANPASDEPTIETVTVASLNIACDVEFPLVLFFGARSPQKLD